MTSFKEENTKVPRHLAVIMDGNGRWAREHSLATRLNGHEVGAKVVREAIKACREMGIRYLTLYTFSTENWKRPKAEVEGLMALLSRFLDANENELKDNGIRLRMMGEREPMPKYLLEKLDRVMENTRDCNELDLVLALNYGGRRELVEAARKLCREAREGLIDPEGVDEAAIGRCLYLPDVPDPELMIRTSGELRLSNFMLWQLSYSELYVTEKYWPDMQVEDFKEAVRAYNGRQRRYGGV